jgi:AHBA synthesis associated protein
LTNNHKIETVIFDLDGVLLNTWNVTEKAFITAHAEVVGSGDPPLSMFKQCQGRGFPSILRLLDLPMSMHLVFIRESRNLIHETTVFAEIPDLLEALRDQSVKMAVATGKDSFRAREVLEHHKLSRYFKLILGSDDVIHGKPAPDIINRLLDFLQTDPKKTLFVGDSVADLQAGHSAGTRTAAALWGEGDPTALLLERPDYEFTSPSDLLHLFLPFSKSDECD